MDPKFVNKNKRDNMEVEAKFKRNEGVHNFMMRLVNKISSNENEAFFFLK